MLSLLVRHALALCSLRFHIGRPNRSSCMRGVLRLRDRYCGPARLPDVWCNLSLPFQTTFLNVLQSALVPGSELNSTGTPRRSPPVSLIYWRVSGSRWVSQQRYSFQSTAAVFLHLLKDRPAHGRSPLTERVLPPLIALCRVCCGITASNCHSLAASHAYQGQQADEDTGLHRAALDEHRQNTPLPLLAT
jgi:hypothetical protein